MNNINPEKRDQIAKAYDSPTWWYDLRGFFILTFAYRSTIWNQVSFFTRNMGAKHLEGAVGSGTLLEIILKWRAFRNVPPVSITAFDYAEPMLDGARRRFANDKHVELILADVGDLKFADNSFDTINVANSVHCFPDIKRAFAELYRVLKPGGHMAINVLIKPRTTTDFWDVISNGINHWGVRKEILVTPYERSDILQQLKEAGFEIDSEAYEGNVSNILMTKPVS